LLDGLRLLSNFLALEREGRSEAGVEAVLSTRGVGEDGTAAATVVCGVIHRVLPKRLRPCFQKAHDTDVAVRPVSQDVLMPRRP